MDKWFVVINPVSGGRKGVRCWKKVKPVLEQKSIQYISRTTEYHRHSSELVKEAISMGYEKIIIIGGDGTLHNVVNGIMTQTYKPSGSILTLMLSVGTGNDWVRSHGMPSDLLKTLDLIEHGKESFQDVGKVEYHHAGKSCKRYFHSFAGAGFDAYVVEHTTKMKQIGQWAYLLGLTKCLLSYVNPEIRVEMNDEVITDKMIFAMAAIGKFGGGGMQLTPNAILDDGLLDATLVKHFSKAEIFMNLHRLYNGTILEHRKVSSFRTRQITISSPTQADMLKMEADGELLGYGPFSVTLIPSGLKFLRPA